MKEDLTYSEAYSKLEKLVNQIERNDIQLDTLANKIREANELIKFCETKLRAIEKKVSEETDNKN